jgi:hypothetical protein
LPESVMSWNPCCVRVGESGLWPTDGRHDENRYERTNRILGNLGMSEGQVGEYRLIKGYNSKWAPYTDVWTCIDCQTFQLVAEGSWSLVGNADKTRRFLCFDRFRTSDAADVGSANSNLQRPYRGA